MRPKRNKRVFFLVLAFMLCGCRSQTAPAETAELAFDQALAFETAQDFKGAIVIYGNILADFPSWGQADQAQLKLGELYQKLGDGRQARLEFTKLKEDFSKSPLVADADYHLVESIFMEGAMAQASQGYYRFVKKYPNHPLRVNAEFNLANCYEELGYFPEALQIYENLKGRYPNPEILQLKIEKIGARRKNLGR